MNLETYLYDSKHRFTVVLQSQGAPRVKVKINKEQVFDQTVESETRAHFFVNLVDENNFLVRFPESPDYASLSKTKDKLAKFAIPVE